MDASTPQEDVAKLVRNIDLMRDDTSAAFSLLQETIRRYQASGIEVPSVFRHIEKDLSLQCFAESQGR